MPKGKFPRTKKNPFDALPEDFKDAVTSASLDQLKVKLSEVTKSDEQNISAAKADQDLQEKKEALKNAAEGYREVAKTNKLKKKFIIQSMSDSGDPVAQSIIQLDLSAAK